MVLTCVSNLASVFDSYVSIFAYNYISYFVFPFIIFYLGKFLKSLISL